MLQILDVRRPLIVFILLAIFAFFIIARLFTLQVWQNNFYELLATGAHEIFRELLPERGAIYIKDGDDIFPAALNRIFYLVYADTRKLQDPETAAQKLAPILEITPQERFELFLKLKEGKARDDPYEPIKQKITEEQKITIEKLNIEGIGFVEQQFRFYPEGNIGAQTIGFYGLDTDGKPVGRYGIEGHFNEALAGKPGFVRGEKDTRGAWIPLGRRLGESAKDGADIILTIDRALQYKLCSLLETHTTEFQAQGAAAVLLEPRTGAVLAMCSVPTFDPNFYNKVEDINVYNNSAIFTAYEPGSVFKPIVMGAALDQEAVAPDTEYEDFGYRKFGSFIIRNAAQKKYGKQTMTQVLEHSINTGMIFVAERLGNKMIREYVKQFRFGQKSGVELDSEVAGDVSSLDKEGEIFGATASFGQGITVTPLQLAAAYGAIANGGKYVSPHMIKEIKYSDGRIEKNRTKTEHKVLTERAAALLVGMLVSTVEKGPLRPARVPGFYIAGKTGTAEIARQGKYIENETNHTFAGFAPVEDPKFVLVIKYEKPKARFADSTAAATFGIMTKFLLQYYGVGPTR